MSWSIGVNDETSVSNNGVVLNGEMHIRGADVNGSMVFNTEGVEANFSTGTPRVGVAGSVEFDESLTLEELSVSAYRGYGASTIIGGQTIDGRVNVSLSGSYSTRTGDNGLQNQSLNFGLALNGSAEIPSVDDGGSLSVGHSLNLASVEISYAQISPNEWERTILLASDLEGFDPTTERFELVSDEEYSAIHFEEMQAMYATGLDGTVEPFSYDVYWHNVNERLHEAQEAANQEVSDDNDDNDNDNDNDDRDPIVVTTSDGTETTTVTVTDSGTTATNNTTGVTTSSPGTNIVLPSGTTIIHGQVYQADNPIFDDNPAMGVVTSTPQAPVINDLGTVGPRPIVMDLDGDGVELAFGDGPRFDWDSDGFDERGTWAAADDGFLVIDLDANGNRNSTGGDGVIDNADEIVWTNLLEASDFDDPYEAALFELSNTFGLSRHTDLEALYLLERRDGWGDGNEILDADDEVWSELRIWQDANQNGVTDEGELLTLNELGFTQIALTYDDGTAFDDPSNDITVFGNTLSGLASFTRNGVVVEGGVGDLSLEVEEDGIRALEGPNGITYTFEDGSDAEFLAVVTDSNPNFAFSTGGRDSLIGVRGNDAANTIDVADMAGNYAGTGQLIEGQGGRDVLNGSFHADLISGGDDRDSIQGRGGHDIIDGGNGTDSLWGHNGDDQIFGGAYHDYLNGGNGEDVLDGGAGDDILHGLNDADHLFGGAGDDRLYGGEGMGFGEMHVASNNFIGDGNWDNDRHERTLADVNNDGRADIVAFGNNAVYVQFGQTDGTFSSSVVGTQQFTGANGESWNSASYGYVRTAADVDGDGNADLVAFGYHDTFVALGNGDGTFEAGHQGSTSFAWYDGWRDDVHERILADVNGDGRADIVAFGNDTVFVHFGQADGTFAGSGGNSSNFTSNNGGWNALNHERTAADVNGDGFADLVAFGSTTTIVALGRGDGTFEANQFAHADFATQDGWDVDIHERRLEDINGDGRADIVGFGDDEVYIALGQTNGTFAASTTATELFASGSGFWTADDDVRDSNDIDGNGYADLIGFGDNAVWVSLQRGDFLVGGEGDDRLVGGGGSDHYVFAEGDGTDVIVGFELGIDMIQFTTPNLDFGDLSIEQSGTASLISYGDGDSIRVYGIEVAQLTDDSFVFV